MIVLNPIGGLASQLHKYFVAYSIAKKYNTKVKFFLDVDRNDKDRPFELNKFNIDIQYVSKLEIFIYLKIFKRLQRLKKKYFYNKNIFLNGLATIEYYSELNNHIFLDYEWVFGDIYFRDFIEDLREMFVLKDEFSSRAQYFHNEIMQTNSVSIHFRRGDYLKENCSEFHGNLTLDYYNNALSMIESDIEEPVYFIFSDDIEWVKEFFIPKYKTYYVNISSHEDIVLMSKCKHNIIANSSYSWFASFFNDYKDKLVIAPKEWVVNKEINKKIYEYMDVSNWKII